MAALPALKLPGILAAREVAAEAQVGPHWAPSALAGRFVELSGGADSAVLTLGLGLVARAQAEGRLAVWVARRAALFYPPDAAAAGVDLAAFPVVLAPDTAAMARVADTLLRSGGFGLVVLDLGGRLDFALGVQTRLAGLAKRHGAALLALTRQGARETPRSSLVSLRGESSRQRVGHDRFLCAVHAAKDKRGAGGWRHVEVGHGPDGLC